MQREQQLPDKYSHRADTHAVVIADIDRIADIHGVAIGHADGLIDSHGIAYSHADGIGHAYRQRNADGDIDGIGDTYGDFDRFGHADGDGHGDAYGYIDGIAHGDIYRVADTHGNGDGVIHAHGDIHRVTNTAPGTRPAQGTKIVGEMVCDAAVKNTDTGLGKESGQWCPQLTLSGAVVETLPDEEDVETDPTVSMPVSALDYSDLNTTIADALTACANKVNELAVISNAVFYNYTGCYPM